VHDRPPVTARVEHLVHQRHLQPRRPDLRRATTTCGCSATTTKVLVVDAPHDPEAIAAAVAGRRVVAIACTHAHDDHVRSAPELAERLSTRCCCTPADRVLWDLTHPAQRPTGPWRTAWCSRWPGRPCTCCTPRARARRGLLLGARPRRRVQRRHAVRRRSRCDGTVVQRLPRPSWTPSGPGCSRCRRRPSCTRDTGTDTTVGAEAPSYDDWVARGPDGPRGAVGRGVAGCGPRRSTRTCHGRHRRCGRSGRWEAAVLPWTGDATLPSSPAAPGPA
jgi:hypothetical protein